MRRISHIEKPQTITHILDHLGLPSEMSPITPARAPPQQELDFVDLDKLASEAKAPSPRAKWWEVWK